MYRFEGEKVNLSDSQWKEKLSPEEFNVLRKKGTEPPFDNAYFDCKKDGTYVCKACGLPLFKSEAKYDSGTGWPSFYEPIYKENVHYEKDATGRIEVTCAACGSHLGHVFDDGPKPTGQRYCMNSVSLKLIQKEKKDART